MSGWFPKLPTKVPSETTQFQNVILWIVSEAVHLSLEEKSNTWSIKIWWNVSLPRMKFRSRWSQHQHPQKWLRTYSHKCLRAYPQKCSNYPVSHALLWVVSEAFLWSLMLSSVWSRTRLYSRHFASIPPYFSRMRCLTSVRSWTSGQLPSKYCRNVSPS